jgi:hypothetical protein
MKKKQDLIRPLKTVFRIADLALFALLIAMPLRPLLKTVPLFLAAYTCAFAAVVLLARIGKARRARETQKREREQRAIERLLLLGDAELKTLTGDPGFLLIRRIHPETEDVANALREGATSIGLFETTEQTRAFLDRNAPQCSVFDRAALLHLVSEEDETAQHMRFRLPGMRIFNKYACLGILFLLLSFLVGRKIYYRSIASVCLILSAFSGFFANYKFMKKIHGIS